MIELMITVAIVGIIAAIAIPAYNQQIRQSRRADAASEVGRLAMAQERWRSDNPTYAAQANLAALGGTATLPSGYYTIGLGTPGGNCASGVAASNANSFSITATAAGAQASDTQCATMVLTSLCGTITRTSTPAGNTCW